MLSSRVASSPRSVERSNPEEAGTESVTTPSWVSATTSFSASIRTSARPSLMPFRTAKVIRQVFGRPLFADAKVLAANSPASCGAHGGRPARRCRRTGWCRCRAPAALRRTASGSIFHRWARGGRTSPTESRVTPPLMPASHSDRSSGPYRSSVAWGMAIKAKWTKRRTKSTGSLIEPLVLYLLPTEKMHAVR